ncbi:D-alanyl-D-alanine dipeptidase [Plectonema cf. radiosum LEGE 06105]|uniref:D-alanyl-D-alanine dipeptidase n=1 Tax=Plectonema cf. radiosum LEGE 06105 TaxID=945769 RepID=A0A8J7JRX9_9CYAN|nr:M15 family metallopeptidase [Plectonema radiosum]MBE9211844.1 D-alanyl-D-alanine dipeptidase [Plectonema cf. radiosum LEGE 06105]
MRPYHNIEIIECGEAFIKIPLREFAVESPHPYEKLGAPYGEHSPYFIRETVVKYLIEAQTYLQQLRPDWRIQIFDAYRPVAVQKFMVNYTFSQVIEEKGLIESNLSEVEKQSIWQEVYKIWAEPSLDEKTPPPHSTGAAVDVTLVDEMGQVVDMGSPIDELSDRSLPDYYAQIQDEQALHYHANRLLLKDVMEKAGFTRNPREWWHFSFGDQMWAWLKNQANPDHKCIACYGRLF